ncbi:TetR/AcrR family transcriptional regulator [Carboxylicivirga sp. A043]|uniref:TetR/AcrR family transcriptional regulator n=1 Tax=Carboxylicivirga litoralis TaxID=2816963 RepID=UPI0021CB53A8|nr:TetR/AcrR family transcriptional regulator [Carboxylicivirga sp. A043]MCU4154914.1 TetR/AcrR family transcriptional regulator [Carboxylicivirga sp. A043]
MSIGIKISLNNKLYLRDPQETSLGQNIIKHSILLIDEIGFEAFTFKKLAAKMNSTEASVYRYFENKHLLLLYLVSWYWEWVSYLIDINTMNIKSAEEKLKIIINTLVLAYKENPAIDYVNESVLHRVIIAEGTKAYYTKEVDKENTEGFFSNYKMLCDKVANVISEVNPDFPYPRALASNLFEMANSHSYFAIHLPRLTDVNVKDENYEEVKDMLLHFTNSLLLNE